MKNESIVVYHSEFERMQDEYWMDVFSNNPDWLIMMPTIMFGIIFFTIFFYIIKLIFGKKR